MARLDVQSHLRLYVGGGGVVHTGNKEGGWCTHTHRMPPVMACSIYRSAVVPVCSTCGTAWWLIRRANDEPRGGVGASDTGGPREQSGLSLMSPLELRPTLRFHFRLEM